jgi:hypothetical protein
MLQCENRTEWGNNPNPDVRLSTFSWNVLDFQFGASSMAGIGARSIMAARKRSRLRRGVARRGLFDPMELPNT